MSVAHRSKSRVVTEDPPRRFGSERVGAKNSSARIWWLLAVVVGGATLLSAFRQPLRDDPFEPARFPGASWWFYPLEQNAHRRLDVITADLNSVFAVEGTNTLWVSGTGGMLAESVDGGRSWIRRDSVDYPSQGRAALEGSSNQRIVSTGIGPGTESTDSSSDAEGMEPGAGGSPALRTLGLVAQSDLSEPTIREAALYNAGTGSVRNEDLQTKKRPDQQKQEPNGSRIGAIAGSAVGDKLGAKAPARKTPPPRSNPVVGEISGFVHGPNREPLKSAAVVAIGPRGPERRTVTKADGSFRIGQLPIDTNVQVTVRMPGYQVYGQTVRVGRGSTDVGELILSQSSSPTASPNDSSTFLPDFPTEDIVAIHFGDRQSGWGVTKGGLLLETTNGGSTWRIRRNVSFANMQTERLIGTDAGIRSAQLTANGRPRWTVLKAQDETTGVRDPSGRVVMTETAETGKLRGVFFFGEQEGWITGDAGVSHTTDGGSTWTSFAGPPLKAAHFINSRVGWAVGDHGTLVKTTDSGASWQSQPSGTASRLNAIYFLGDGTHGWVAGSDGTILATSNGGKKWIHLTQGSEGRVLSESGQPSHWPSPITALGILLSLAFGVKAARTSKAAPPEPETGVADMLVSDRPLELGEPDALDLNSIALGLSRFLRNERTLPPLSIAITGEWGTGKSSLMNLLRSDLRGHGFRPVWFNAWHHQKEEHLLASLLQCVRLEAVPHWWTPEGTVFRLRLLAIRSRRHWVPLLLLLSAFSIFAGYALNSEEVFNLRDLLGSLASLNMNQLLRDLTALASDGGTLGFLITLIGVVRSLWKGSTAFGVNPASLVSSMSGGGRLRNLDAQISFRQKFSREFRDVTSALGPRSMLILIDDLDRCRPDQVLEVLEAVNFLVSSGECFVVMGMARGRVEGCVGLSFRDVAAELLEGGEPGVAGDGAAGRATRRAFARQYLDKLINIEVPVPAPSPDQSRMLLRLREGGNGRPAASRLNAGLRRVEPFLGPLAAMTLLAITIGAGYQFGRELAGPGSETENIPEVAASPGTLGQATMGEEPAPGEESGGNTSKTPPLPSVSADARGSKSRTSAPTGPPTDPNPIDEPSPPVEIKPASASIKMALGFSLVPIALAFVPLFAAYAFHRPPDLIVVDSPEFEKALEIWHPLVSAADNTPRGMKRFMNRVRYMAMRQQVQRPYVPLLQRILRNFGFSGPETTKPPGAAADNIPESILVALTAIHTYNPSWLQSDSVFSKGPGATTPGISDCIPFHEAREKHEQAFNNWRLMQNHRRLFLIAASGVRVN